MQITSTFTDLSAGVMVAKICNASSLCIDLLKIFSGSFEYTNMNLPFDAPVK